MKYRFKTPMTEERLIAAVRLGLWKPEPGAPWEKDPPPPGSNKKVTPEERRRRIERLHKILLESGDGVARADCGKRLRVSPETAKGYMDALVEQGRAEIFKKRSNGTLKHIYRAK